MPEPDPQDPHAAVAKPAAPAAAPVAPVAPAAPAAPPAPAPDGGNSTIRQMRETIAAGNTENADLKAQLLEAQGKVTEADRKDLADLDRMTLERDDALKKLEGHDGTVTELAALSTAMEGSYKTRLEAVEEKHRPNVEALSKDGNWADRLTKLDSAIALLPTPQSVGHSGSPAAPAAPEQPATPGSPATPPEPLDLKAIAKQGGSIAPHLGKVTAETLAAARGRPNPNVTE